ncbi:MAG: hypothetical protein ACXWEI_21790, partial [Mycobacterium sp.]
MRRFVIDRQGEYLRTSEPARHALIDSLAIASAVWCALAATIALVATGCRRMLAESAGRGHRRRSGSVVQGCSRISP